MTNTENVSLKQTPRQHSFFHIWRCFEKNKINKQKTKPNQTPKHIITSWIPWGKQHSLMPGFPHQARFPLLSALPSSQHWLQHRNSRQPSLFSPHLGGMKLFIPASSPMSCCCTEAVRDLWIYQWLLIQTSISE